MVKDWKHSERFTFNRKDIFGSSYSLILWVARLPNNTLFKKLRNYSAHPDTCTSIRICCNNPESEPALSALVLILNN